MRDQSGRPFHSSGKLESRGAEHYSASHAMRLPVGQVLRRLIGAAAQEVSESLTVGMTNVVSNCHHRLERRRRLISYMTDYCAGPTSRSISRTSTERYSGGNGLNRGSALNGAVDPSGRENSLRRLQHAEQ